MKFRIFSLSILIVCTFGNIAHALDEESTIQWIDTLDSIKSWAEDHNQQIDNEIRTLDEPRDIDLERVWSDEFLQTPEVRNFIKGHVFDTLEEWNRVSSRMLGAFLSLKMRDRLAAAKVQQEEYREEIAAHPDIPPEQKEEFYSQMDEQLEYLRKLAHSAPEEDVVALKPHMNRLSEIVERYP